MAMCLHCLGERSEAVLQRCEKCEPKANNRSCAADRTSRSKHVPEAPRRHGDIPQQYAYGVAHKQIGAPSAPSRKSASLCAGRKPILAPVISESCLQQRRKIEIATQDTQHPQWMRHVESRDTFIPNLLVKRAKPIRVLCWTTRRIGS